MVRWSALPLSTGSLRGRWLQYWLPSLLVGMSVVATDGVGSVPILRLGRSVMIQLSGDPHRIWHERVIVLRREGGDYIAVTPDSDLVELTLTTAFAQLQDP